MDVDTIRKKTVLKLTIWLVISVVIGWTLGLITSPGDYPWALKLIMSLWFFILLFHLVISKDHKGHFEVHKNHPRNSQGSSLTKEAKESESTLSEIISETKPIDPHEIDKSYFEKKYEIVFYVGSTGEKGKLIFDETTTIDLSKIENDLCIRLFNGLKDSWFESQPKDIGWVSYDDLRNSVTVWKKKIDDKENHELPDTIVNDLTIINAISRLNKSIREKLGLNDSINLLENGDLFSRSKHYRFRINLGNIDIIKRNIVNNSTSI